MTLGQYICSKRTPNESCDPHMIVICAREYNVCLRTAVHACILQRAVMDAAADALAESLGAVASELLLATENAADDPNFSISPENCARYGIYCTVVRGMAFIVLSAPLIRPRILLQVLVKAPCECTTGIIERGLESITHSAAPRALSSLDRKPRSIIPVVHSHGALIHVSEISRTSCLAHAHIYRQLLVRYTAVLSFWLFLPYLVG